MHKEVLSNLITKDRQAIKKKDKGNEKATKKHARADRKE